MPLGAWLSNRSVIRHAPAWADVRTSAYLAVSRNARSDEHARSSGATLVMRSSRRAPVRSSAPVSLAISPTVRPTGCLKNNGSVNPFASRTCPRFLDDDAPAPLADRELRTPRSGVYAFAGAFATCILGSACGQATFQHTEGANQCDTSCANHGPNKTAAESPTRQLLAQRRNRADHREYAPSIRRFVAIVVTMQYGPIAGSRR